MTISELIKKLEKIKAKHGDLPVTYFADDSYYDFHDVNNVSVQTWSGQYYKTPVKAAFLRD